MSRKSFVYAGAILLFAVGMVYAAGNGAFLGTWKLNEAKSKIAAGMPKNSTVVYTADGDNVKVGIDGTDAKGQTFHSDWTGTFDGKDYALTGDPSNDMRSYKVVNDHTLLVISKKGGKETFSTRIVVSADGKTRTVTVSGTDASGAKTTSTQIYDQQ
ncbi:MAG TPA: hypothetical protein VKH63_20405 [Candidatus Acidoferrum sp.]|nr:hypothetical protein [Candidatus Acidoferrum sp.]